MPKGKSGKKYLTAYAIVDSTGDGIPELHIRNTIEYYIVSFENGETKESCHSRSSAWQDTVLKDGTLVNCVIIVSALVLKLGVYTNVYAADYIEVEVNTILYSNVEVIFYSDADLLLNIVLTGDEL